MNCSHPIFSIIVPVYNVEQYLPQCIDSILQQSFPYFELLLIDDGSSDSSGVICDEYALKDKRIRVFHEQNGGVSIARNIGIENVKGEWILFVDSDDWIDTEALNYIATNRKDADFIQFGFRKTDGTVLEYSNIPNEVLELSSQDYCNSKVYHPAICGYVIKLNVIKKYNLKFPAGIKYGEDQVFILKVLMCSSLVVVLNRHFYNYRVRYGSAMNSSLSFSMAKDHLLAIEDLLDFSITYHIKLSSLCIGVITAFIKTYFWISIRGLRCIGEIKEIKKNYSQFLICKDCYKYLPAYFRIWNSYSLIVGYYFYVRMKLILKLEN